MKKSISRIIHSIGVCFIICLFISCSDKKVENLNNSQKIEDYAIYGITHNQMLTLAHLDFPTTRSIQSFTEGKIHVAEFQASCIDQLAVDDSSKELLKEGITKNADWYNPNNLYNDCFLGTRDSNNQTLQTQLSQMYNAQAIDKFEYDNLQILCTAIMENYNGSITAEELQLIVKDMIKLWENQQYGLDSQYGRTLAIALSISQSSLEWWNENTDALGQTRVVAAWVGADIAGALIGSVSSIGGQLMVGGDVNWKSVGWSAVSGAVVGSTGIVGKVGSWISKLFV